jgi:hypothetical protein
MTEHGRYLTSRGSHDLSPFCPHSDACPCVVVCADSRSLGNGGDIRGDYSGEVNYATFLQGKRSESAEAHL